MNKVTTPWVQQRFLLFRDVPLVGSIILRQKPSVLYGEVSLKQTIHAATLLLQQKLQQLRYDGPRQLVARNRRLLYFATSCLAPPYQYFGSCCNKVAACMACFIIGRSFDIFLFMHKTDKTEPTECPGVSSTRSSSGVSSGAAAGIAIVMFIVGMICTMVLVLVVRFWRTRRKGFNLLHSKYRKQENEMEGFAD